MELEDRYGIRVSEEEAAEIATVGDAVEFVLTHAPAGSGVGAPPEGAAAPLAALLESLPEELAPQALTHSSWVERRSESYGRLAFLGDSVLGLAIAAELHSRFPDADSGELTKIHNQAVSARAIAEVARELGIPELIAERAPSDGSGLPAETLTSTERPLAEVTEAVIGACFLETGSRRPRRRWSRQFERPDRLRDRDQARFQVRAPGTARPQRRDRKLRGRKRGRPAARQALRGQGERPRRSTRQRFRPIEEGS